MGYRPAGLRITSTLHDHGGECDEASDRDWAAFCAAVRDAADSILRQGGEGAKVWIEHVNCDCATCQADEEDES